MAPLDEPAYKLKSTSRNDGLRGGCQAWSTAPGLGPGPQWFAGSNPAPRTQNYFYNEFLIEYFTESLMNENFHI